MDQSLVILLILALMDKNPNIKETIQNALKLYRENKDLISLLISNSAPETEQKESRPEEVGNPNEKILEEYLKARTGG